MSRVLNLLLLQFLLLIGSTVVWAQKPGDSGSPSDACLAFKRGLSLGASLPHTAARLKSGQTLTVVALGSSSTTGFGTFGSGGAFPDVMKQELSRLRPSARIEIVNSGRVMDDLPANVARIDNDVLRYRPDLVVWQIGTNDVVWRGVADNAKEILDAAVKQLKAANTDVILLDLQYTPLVLASGRHTRMEQIIADVARGQNVGLFPRFLLTRRAIEAGVQGPGLLGRPAQLRRRL